MSKHQVDTAVRVASVPEEEFEELIDSVNPPTVTKHKKGPIGNAAGPSQRRNSP